MPINIQELIKRINEKTHQVVAAAHPVVQAPPPTPPPQPDIPIPPTPPPLDTEDQVNAAYPIQDYPNPYAGYISQSTCSIDATNDVSPGEMCTLDQLSSLGIYDSQNYISPENNTYKDLKTFNGDKDNKENRTKSLCKQTLKGDSANLNCLYEHGAGYIRKPGDADTCITYDCPPGFEKNGNDCKKILLDAKVDKRAQCQERWSDWFIVPNYHLGNNYNTVNDSCYSPCPSHYVPNYATDPVDNSKIDFSSSDKLDKCVARNIYFDGKYAEGSEYCPLAWIYRASATADSLNKEYVNVIQASGSNVNHNQIYNTLLRNSKSMSGSLLDNTNSLFEDANVTTPEMDIACSGLYTSERVAKAYEICKSLKHNEEDFKEKLAQGDQSGAVDQKITILKQSCNAIFCQSGDNADDTPFILIGKDTDKDKICFASTGDVDPNKIVDVDTLGNIEDAENPTPTADSGETLLYATIQLFYFIILIPVIIVLIYYFVKHAGPMMMDVAFLLWRVITFKPISISATKHPQYIDIILAQAEKWEKFNPEKSANAGIFDTSWRLYGRDWCGPGDCSKS